ncbi:MAG: hypothetical protein Q4B54_06305 [Coriobacteriales bacterium]|nr:hypothetical protein [Coriobacteriales bacterium]
MTNDKKAKAQELLDMLDSMGIVIIHPENVFEDWPEGVGRVDNAVDAETERSKAWHEDAVLNLGLAD